jgi:hypothetical protein
MSMAAHVAELAAILARLDRLERQNRWLKGGAVLLLVLAGTGLLTAAQNASKDKDKVMQGERFSLRDASGHERAWLGMGKAGGPQLRFLDANGDERAAFEMANNAMTLRLLDAKGNLQTGVSLELTGVAVVSYDDTGRPLVGPNALKSDAGILVAPRRSRP